MTKPTADPDVANDVYMSEDARRAHGLLLQLSQQLDNRIADVLRFQRYYDGEQPLRFATAEYQQHFGAQFAGFADNWCAPVVDTTAEKLTPTGILLPAPDSTAADGVDAPASKREADRDFAKIWQANECPAEVSQAFTEAGIAKRAFALVWGDGDGTGIPDITFETADEVIVGYEPGSRRRRKAALKRWTDGEYDYGTLYLPDAIWKWQRLRPEGDLEAYTPDEMRRFDWITRNVPRGDEAIMDNPSGVVPMIEIPNRPRLKSEPLSDVAGAAAMQDAINALWAYLFTAADFAAMPQRVVTGAIKPRIPILDTDGKPTGVYKDVDINEFLKPALMARMMAFEGDNAKIAQWDPAKLDVFTNSIEFAVGHLAAQTRTPAHYFTGKIVNVPADGLIALAQAHISKIRERAVYHTRSIKEIGATCHLMNGDTAKAEAVRLGQVMWQDFEIRSDNQMADLAIKLRQSGFSFPYVAQKFISDPIELAEEIERHNAEEAKKAAMMEFGPKAPPIGDGQLVG